MNQNIERRTFLAVQYHHGRDFDVGRETRGDAAIALERELDSSLGVGADDIGSDNLEPDPDLLEASRMCLATVRLHVDRKRGHRRAALGEVVDDVDACARSERAEERVRRRLARLAPAIEARGGSVRLSGVEGLIGLPRRSNVRRGMYCRRRDRWCRCFGRGDRGIVAHFSMGARTALPHSVQLPS